MIKKENLYKIGIGTWKIDYEHFENDIDALVYSHNKGENYLSLYMLYNNGEVVKQMRKFLDKIDREKVFINVNLEPTIKEIEDIEKQLDEYLKILDIKYVDNLQIHGSFVSEIPLVEVYKEIKRLVDIGKVRYIGISNVNLEQLKEISSLVRIDFFEGVYNLECKLYEDIGVLNYCKENDIKFICYQPLRRNRTARRNYPLLVELALKYNKTQNQIILNWIINRKNIMPLIKSTNIERIDENNESINFKMSDDDYNKLDDFRNTEFDNVKIDWDCNGGVTIDQLANQFE
jgi:diketogulonate reductase-like aldo/keto reductase